MGNFTSSLDPNYGSGSVASDMSGEDSNPRKLPTVEPFVKPQVFSPLQQSTQKASYNPSSVSHNYLARFGQAKHF
jgi:hypothetical protein